MPTATRQNRSTNRPGSTKPDAFTASHVIMFVICGLDQQQRVPIPEWFHFHMLSPRFKPCAPYHGPRNHAYVGSWQPTHSLTRPISSRPLFSGSPPELNRRPEGCPGPWCSRPECHTVYAYGRKPSLSATLPLVRAVRLRDSAHGTRVACCLTLRRIRAVLLRYLRQSVFGGCC